MTIPVLIKQDRDVDRDKEQAGAGQEVNSSGYSGKAGPPRVPFSTAVILHMLTSVHPGSREDRDSKFPHLAPS